MKKLFKKYLSAVMVLSFVIAPFLNIHSAQAQVSAIRTIVFPVIGKVTYYDDFGAVRDGGARSHEGNDLMGKKMLPLVAAVDGTIVNVNYPESSWGYSVTIKDKDGYTYHYIHMNNDTPGTDDGRGDGINAYAPEVKEGNKVAKGQLLGYMGDSGNAETTQAHLHFEIRLNGSPFSPYKSLQNATVISNPVPAPKQDNEILPYDNFTGGANVATGNFDRDTDLETVTGAGPGGGPLVKVFDDDGDQLSAFYAYGTNFTGGIDVAAVDLDDDGKAEIVTAPGAGGGPHIKIFEMNGKLIREFFAYDASFTGGVFVSAADTENDGEGEIITGAGPGGGPHVKIFNSDGTIKSQFFPYDPNFHGGVDVAAIPAVRSSTRRTSSSSKGGYATVPYSGGGAHVKVYDEDAKIDHEFFAFETNVTLGFRIAAGNANTTNSGAELVVLPARGGGPHVKVFSLAGKQLFSNLIVFEPWWRGGYDFAVTSGGGVMSSFGGRRASVRETTFRTTTTDRTRTSN